MQHSDVKNLYGIKEDSYLNKLNYYHVCNPGLPPCIAHDLYEGIIPYDLHLILNYFIAKNIITLNEINLSLPFFRKKFHLHLAFPQISENIIKIPGKCNEIYHLLFLLPLVFLNKIQDYEDPVWKFLTVMIEMCRIINSPEITNNQILLLTHYIRLFFEYRKESFNNEKVRPKHHYICHYPELIRKFGPLKNLWTLNFEQKHQAFKNKARKVKNFKNIVKTLAENHQQEQAIILNDSFISLIKCNTILHVTQNMFDIELPPNFEFVSKKISYLNTEYKENDIVFINCDKENDLDFLKISAIFINTSYTEAIFYGRLFKMVYDKHLILYENLSDSKICYTKIELSKLLIPKPVNLYAIQNKLYYSPFIDLNLQL